MIFYGLILIIAGWFVFSTAGGVYLYFSSLSPKKGNEEKDRKSLAAGYSAFEAHTKDPVIMVPLAEAKERWKANRKAGLFEELSLTTRKKISLAGWYWPAEGSGLFKTVLLVHGIMDSGAGMGYLAEEYHRRNWNVLSIDLRAHGESGGKRITLGVREAEDIGLWVDLLDMRYGAKDVFLHGISMGGAAVLLYAGKTHNLPSSLKGIIADSTYARYGVSFSKLIRLIVGNRFISWSLSLGASLASFLFSGVPFSRMCPEKMIAGIRLPVLLFHGGKDVLLPIEMINKMFDHAVKLGHDTVVIPEAPHIGAYFYAPELYMKTIDDFSRRNT